jgi:hypothetical protein
MKIFFRGMRLTQSAGMRRKRLATGVLLFIMVLFIILIEYVREMFEGAVISHSTALVLFVLFSLKKWSGIALLGFSIGYFMKRYGPVLAFLIGFVISIYRVAIRMTTPTEIFFLLEIFFAIWVWAGFGLGFIGYGASVLGRRVRERAEPFINKREFVGIGIISVFTIWLVLIEMALPLYYPPRFYPQIYACATYGSFLIIPLTAFLYGIWSKERHGIMSFMVAYFPWFVFGCSGSEGSWACFPIGTIFGLAGLAGWLVSKYRRAKSA